MATDTQATAPALALYRLTVKQYEKMIDADVFPRGAHVELLGGLLVEKMTKNDPHDVIVAELGEVFRRLLPAGWSVREEKSLRLGRYWRPEPDLTVVRGRHREYYRRTPRAEDLALVVEVANTSYAKDRGVLWRRFAASRIVTYWIVDVNEPRIEVYSRPSGRGNAAKYLDCTIHGAEDEVPLIVEGREVGRFPVRDLLP